MSSTRNNRVFVTGSNSFIGDRLCEVLTEASFEVVRGVRDENIEGTAVIRKDSFLHYKSIDENTNWQNKLQNIDIVVHLAGRVHVTNETEKDPISAFRRINSNGTEKLALAAAEHGISRFIFLSTVGVNGCKTTSRAYTEEDHAAPYNDYTQSKFEAENKLLNIAENSGLEIVIVRSPLVYGPGVKANFLLLLNLLNQNLLFPICKNNNMRSYIGLNNLVDFVSLTINHPAACNEIFLVSDDEDISTYDLINLISKKMKNKPILLNIPSFLLLSFSILIGKSKVVKRLYNSLKIDISKAKNKLGWSPPLSIDKELDDTIKWFEEKYGYPK